MNGLRTRCVKRLKNWAASLFALCSGWWLLAPCPRSMCFGVFSFLLRACMRSWQVVGKWRIMPSARSR